MQLEREAGAGAQELLNLTHPKFVPISIPTLLIHWLRTGMGWPLWAGRLHSKNLPTVWFCLQARKGLWDLTQPSEGLCQGSQGAHGASQQSPFSRLPQQLCASSAQCSHGTAPGNCTSPSFCCAGESRQRWKPKCFPKPTLESHQNRHCWDCP